MSTINTNHFIDKDNINEFERKPYLIDDRVVANNSHIMLITNCADDCNYDPCSADKIESRKKLVNLIDNTVATKDMSPIPHDLVFPEHKQCRHCKGSGKSTQRTCEECGGSGEMEFQSLKNWYNFSCKSCAGDGYIYISGGYIDCTRCESTGGRYPSKSYVEILDILIDPTYLSIIKDVPGMLVCAANVNGECNGLFFKTESCRGLIMPVKSNK